MGKIVVSEDDPGRIIGEEYTGVLEADIEDVPVYDKILANVGFALTLVLSVATAILLFLF